MTRKTVGQASQELIKDQHTQDHAASEQGQEMLREYESGVHEAIQTGIKTWKGDFYVVVLTKQERLMKNVIRLYMLTRQSCPTPQHDQTVYLYHRVSGDIEELWTVPSLQACVTLVNEALMVHPDERQLLDYVLQFRDGTLLRKAQELNGELIPKETHGTRTRTSH